MSSNEPLPVIRCDNNNNCKNACVTDDEPSLHYLFRRSMSERDSLITYFYLRCHQKIIYLTTIFQDKLFCQPHFVQYVSNSCHY